MDAALIDRLQFLPRFKPHCLSGRNRNFGASPRIASNAGLSGPHIEDAKSAQLNAVAVSESFLHALKNSFHRQLGFRFGYTGSSHYFVDNVELDHERLPDAW
jgi:hypothetical protein